MNYPLRIARPTDHLDRTAAMFRDGLGLSVLGHFLNHEGFDGVMLGSPGAIWHLEFTQQRGHTPAGPPSTDNLLVFYVNDHDQWRTRNEQMRKAGFRSVSAHTPYWDRLGTAFEDPDGYRVVYGYRVVLCRGSWPPS